MKKDLIKFLKNFEEFENIDLENILEVPKNIEFGDLTFPCFILSKTLKKNPNEIAENLNKKLNEKVPSFLDEINLIGAYINFKFNKGFVCEKVLNSIHSNEIFNFTNNSPKKILIEWPSPNTNKSLHIGHIRNMILGKALCNILEKTRNKVIKTNLYNDRGIAICKSLLMYDLFGENKTPKDFDMAPDIFCQKFYEMFEKKVKEDKNNDYEKKAQEYLVLWESGDKKIRDNWKRFLSWVFDGYKKTFEDFKMPKFDKNYYESLIYDKGREIIENALKNKIEGFELDKSGAVFVDFKNDTLGKKYLLRADKTSVYMTQDLYLDSLKEKDFSPDLKIFIVGCEQEYHFNVLFEILKRINKENQYKNIHYSYGYVFNKDGKKFSSRSGNTINASWLLNKVIKKAEDEILKRDYSKNLEKTEIKKRANKIGFSALNFSFLKPSPRNSINFDIEKSISFEGDSAGYILYTIARINSILKKEKINLDKIEYNNILEDEFLLCQELNNYKDLILEASNKLKPNLLCNYLIKICRKFNEYYSKEKIIGSNNINFKLFLLQNILKVLEDVSKILDIETLKEM